MKQDFLTRREWVEQRFDVPLRLGNHNQIYLGQVRQNSSGHVQGVTSVRDFVTKAESRHVVRIRFLGLPLRNSAGVPLGRESLIREIGGYS